MKQSLMRSVCNPAFWAQLAVASLASAQTVDQLILHKVKLESVDYLGKRAVKITEDRQVADGEAYAIVKGSAFSQRRDRSGTGGACPLGRRRRPGGGALERLAAVGRTRRGPSTSPAPP